jgi:hypothetical protein
MKLFNEYMKPIIIEKLDIPFTKKELERELKKILEHNPELGAQEYKVTGIEDYKVTSSLQYQISDKYGSGTHYLIPNKANIGIGKQKHNKKRAGLRYCTVEEFKANDLKVNHIDLKHLLQHLKPFYNRNEKLDMDKYEQKTFSNL